MLREERFSEMVAIYGLNIVLSLTNHIVRYIPQSESKAAQSEINRTPHSVRIADNPAPPRLSSTVISIAPLSHSLVRDAHAWMWSSQPVWSLMVP